MDKSFFEANLTRVHEWIKAADQKVSIWIAFQGILVAVITPYFSDHIFPSIFEQSWVVIVLLVFSICLYGYGFFQSILAITPSLKTKKGKKSLIYFGHVAEMDFDDFELKLDQYTEEDYLKDLKRQIHISSKIAFRKHKEFRYSIIFFFSSVVLFLPVVGVIKF